MGEASSMTPYYVLGPTGGGKSSVAMALARRWDGEIVNADAFQLYQGMPIVTASPPATDQAEIPHHLYGVVPLEEDCHVARYVSMAEKVIEEIQERGRRPIVVGGSGLYIKGLTHGLADVPAGNEALREALSAVSESDRVRWFRKLDPVGADQTNLLNPRYVMRSLEMVLLSGVPASELKARWQREEPQDLDGVVLQWERSELYTRINDRVRFMLEEGALEEIDALPNDLSSTASKAIGVRELQAYLRGECLLEEAITAMQQATRRYAKRQETWFRRERAFRRMTVDEVRREQ